jgi:type IV pilus assembly protein PilB
MTPSTIATPRPSRNTPRAAFTGHAAPSDPEPAPKPLSDLQTAERLTDELSADYLEQYAVLPIAVKHGVITVATWLEAIDPQAEDDLALVLHGRIALVQYPEADVRAAIRKVYGSDGVTAEELIAGMSSDSRVTADGEIPLDDLLTLANEAPVVKLVNLLLIEA